MTIHGVSFGKVILVAAVTAATPAVATVILPPFQWDNVVTAIITGIFGLVQIRMLSKLHTMVNSQQSDLNRISETAQRAAGLAEGKLQGLAQAAAEKKGDV